MKSKTVDEYIGSFPESKQEKLRELRKCVQDALPEATEELKWGSPAYSEGTILVAFAGFTDHMNFYPTPDVVSAFKNRLSDYQTGGASVRLSYEKPLPVKLINEMIVYRVKEYKERGIKWMS